MSAQVEMKLKARPLSPQQKQVLVALKEGPKSTGYFARLIPAILRVSERVRELEALGYLIKNEKLAVSGHPNGMAMYHLTRER